MAPDGKEREVCKHLSSFFSFWFERTVCIENGAEGLVILLWTTDIWAKGNPAPCLALPAMTDPCLYAQQNWWCSTSGCGGKTKTRSGQGWRGYLRVSRGEWEVWGWGKNRVLSCKPHGRLGVSERAESHMASICVGSSESYSLMSLRCARP